MTAELQEGELVLLLDSKQRQYLVTLQSGKEFHSHAGYISHDEILGADVVLFYAIEAESRLTGETPYAVAAGDPAAEEALEAVTQRRIRTHCMREWLDRSWPIVSDRAGIILTAEGIARA